MFKLYQAIRKELTLLKRDIFGLVIIFLMPVVLILTITPIQFSIENKSEQVSLPILLINKDNDELSQKMIKNLSAEKNLKFVTDFKHKKLTEKQGKDLIKEGKQQVLIVIPPDFSKQVQHKIDTNIEQLLSQVVPGYDKDGNKMNTVNAKLNTIEIYFDPIVSDAVKSKIRTSINQMTADMETKMIYQTFEDEFDTDLSYIKDEKLISFKEETLALNQNKIAPSPIQHNMPAWALFAIFLIVIPLSINIVEEKNQGTYIRLKTLPIHPFYLMLSKIGVYLLVCMIQFYLMVLVSIYLFPLLGMPALEVGGKIGLMSVVAFFAGLAAIGFGVLIGTIANTHEQSAPFGATSVVILAAVGGLWFPVYAMSETMQMIAKISPMNWGLQAFYNVLLRQSDFMALTPYLCLLLLFFTINIVLAVIYEKKSKII